MKVLAFAIALVLPPSAARAAGPPPTVRFDRVVIDPDLADAYQVEVADVDGDKKPDIIALGNNTINWYQNPTWTKRTIGATGSGPLKADIISSATTDLDGDGRAEVAIACDFAMNTPTRGQLYLASPGATLDAPWTLRKVADVPSIHRLRWGDLDGDGKPELVVAPIFGPKALPPTYDQDPARVVWLRPGNADPATGFWVPHPILERPVVHAVKVMPAPSAGGDLKIPATILTADNTGLSFAQIGPNAITAPLTGRTIPPTTIIPGASGAAPKRGSSDVATGSLGPARIFYATIDPWHGSNLVVWQPQGMTVAPPTGRDPEAAARRVIDFARLTGSMLVGRYFTQTVIDPTLDDGHALWVADADGDGTDEIFAGHRGKDYRVAMYRFDGKTWDRTILDTAIAAQDLRGGDLDGDGVPDVVAVGGKTHNVVWYRPVRVPAERPGLVP